MKDARAEEHARPAQSAQQQLDAAGHRDDEWPGPHRGVLDPALLHDSRVLQRANAPLRQALLLHLQRTHGNAYARQVAGSLPLGPAPGRSLAVQRQGPGKEETGSGPTFVKVHVEAAQQGNFTAIASGFYYTASASAEMPKDDDAAQPKPTVIRLILAPGSSSGKLQQALQSNELLLQVRLDFWQTTVQGVGVVTQRVTLHNARVAGMEQISGPEKKPGAREAGAPEEVTLVGESLSAENGENAAPHVRSADRPRFRLHLKRTQHPELVVAGYSYSFEAAVPGGAPAAPGKLLKVVKAFGKGSVELLQALEKNESLESVRLDFLQVLPGGVEMVTERIIVSPARVQAITEEPASEGDARGGPVERESVTFAFGDLATQEYAPGHQGKRKPPLNLHVTGTQQGSFALTAFAYHAGQASGKQETSLLDVTVKVGAGSNALLQALATQELLAPVTGTVFKSEPGGGKSFDHSFALQEATVARIGQEGGNLLPTGSTPFPQAQISLAYRPEKAEGV